MIWEGFCVGILTGFIVACVLIPGLSHSEGECADASIDPNPPWWWREELIYARARIAAKEMKS